MVVAPVQAVAVRLQGVVAMISAVGVVMPWLVAVVVTLATHTGHRLGEHLG